MLGRDPLDVGHLALPPGRLGLLEDSGASEEATPLCTAALRLSRHPLRDDLESALRKLVVGAHGLLSSPTGLGGREPRSSQDTS